MSVRTEDIRLWLTDFGNWIRTGNLPEKVWNSLMQLLFPRRCPVCDGIVTPSGEKICAQCLRKLQPLKAPWCRICGIGLRREGELCGECRAGRKHFFVRARTLYRYQSVSQAIYRFKYGGRREYGEFFGEEMAEYLGDFARSIHADGLIPVPLHSKRLSRRGFNQAAVLAHVLGKKWGIPVYEKLLIRRKNTVPLKALNSKERQNNLKKAFHVKENDVKLKTIIMVDDIYTTGATVDEAARTLLDGGAEKVYVVTLAGSEE
ncbi:MAG: ComF family protein [Lachnospiraceae bacterium]|nr:ComF family protein [Lachnospiraceae bacterium]